MKRRRADSRYQLRARRAPPLRESSLADEQSLASDDNVAGDEDWMSAAEESNASDDIEQLDENIVPLDDDIKQLEDNVAHPEDDIEQLVDDIDSKPGKRIGAATKIEDNTDWAAYGDERTSAISISSDAASGIQTQLLRWYFRNARSLPWRVPPQDPDGVEVVQEPAAEESAPGAPYAV